MTGNFFITLDYLKELNLASHYLHIFKKEFPKGGEYKKVLKLLADKDFVPFGLKLLSKLGATRDILTFDGPVHNESKAIIFSGDVIFKGNANIKYLFVGGSIKADGDIKVSGWIEAGGDIDAGGSIESRSIDAGGSISAGRHIEAVPDTTGVETAVYGYINAGYNIKAFGGVKAAGYINIGGSLYSCGRISVGWYIKTGSNHGAFEGMVIPDGNRLEIGQAMANAKLTGLISGGI